MSVRDAIQISRQEALGGRPIEERRRATAADQRLTPLRRMVLRAVDEVIFGLARPGNVREFEKMRQAGIEHIGAGSESSVLRVGNQVLKCVHGSHEWTEAKRQQRVAEKVSDFESIAEHFSDFVLDQRIAVDTHPFYRDRRMVQTAQPFVEAHDAIVHSGGPQDVLTIMPGTPLDQLSNFIDAAHAMHHKTGLLPDMNGNNLVNVDDELVLIDTQPIDTESPIIQATILSRLDSLSRQLDERDKSRS